MTVFTTALLVLRTISILNVVVLITVFLVRSIVCFSQFYPKLSLYCFGIYKQKFRTGDLSFCMEKDTQRYFTNRAYGMKSGISAGRCTVYTEAEAMVKK